MRDRSCRRVYINGLNKLPTEKRAQILQMMVEGVSIRAISRMTNASKNTIVKLLAAAGQAFSEYQDKTLRDLPCRLIEADEIWSFGELKAEEYSAGKARDF